MSSITAGTYPAESVSSCSDHPPSPPPSPPPHPAPASAEAAIHGARPFDFPDASSDGDLDEYDDDFIRVLEYIERAKPCVCGRGGRCAVERDEQRGRWVYVCPSQPRCNHVSVCEEVGLDPDLKPAVRSHPRPSNNCVINISSNHVAEPGTPINNVSVSEEVGLDPELQPAVRSHPRPSNNCVINVSSNHVAEPGTPINNVNLRGAVATTPNIVSPQATIPRTPFNSTFQSAGTSTPLHVSPKDPSATAVVKISPQGAGSNGKRPICKCNAGKCVILRKGREDYYVCPIPKGNGACSYMVPVVAAVSEPTQTATRGDKHLKDNLVEKEDNGSDLEDNIANGSVNPPQPDEKEVDGNNLVQAQDNNANGSVNSQSDDEWPYDVVNDEIVLTAETTTSAEVHQASPSMKCETTAMAESPTESPVLPYDTSSPIIPCSENRVSPTGRILQACGELLISCCSGLCPP